MKINEKNLCGFAVSDSPVDKEGWLLKRGEVNKSFQRRWFTLKGNLLFYFEKKTDKEPSGVIVLEGCTIDLAEYEEQYAFKIVFHGAGDRTYVLGADTQETMEAWMKALACASYDYMKLMVSELQRQLDEIVELEKAHASIFDDPKHKEVLGASAGGRVLVAPPNPRQPQAPSRSRRSASQPKKESPLVNQRLNPFDRDVVVGNVKQHQQLQERHPREHHSSSAPGTPRSVRHSSAEKNCSTHDVCGAQPSRRLEHSVSLRSESPAGAAALTMTLPTTASLSHLCRPFFKLHELYGAKIMSDVHIWNNKKDVCAHDGSSVLLGDLVYLN